MTEGKHTPGPWQLENGQWGDHSEDAGGGFHLLMGDYESPDGIGIRSARLLQYGDGFYEGDNGYEEVAANARLIAAAPELLEWGAELLTLLDDYMQVTSLTANLRYAVALGEFRKAIARAEGRQSTIMEGGEG